MNTVLGQSFLNGEYGKRVIWKTFRTDPDDYIAPGIKATLTSQRMRCMGFLGISYFTIKVGLLLATCLYVCVPTVLKETPEQIVFTHIFAGFMFGNLMINYLLITKNRSFYSSSKDTMQGLPSAIWDKCIDCQHDKPPRTHHCNLCGHCILKRDHHCFFTGCCIGFHNQRYFVVYCFYAAIGSAYAGSYLLRYIEIDYNMKPISWDFYHFIIPWTVIEWILGYVTLGFVYYVTMALLTLSSAVSTAVLMCFQMYLIISGRTMHEFNKGIQTHKSNVVENFRSVFGPLWLLNFIVPLPCLKNTGDGIHWGTSKYV